MALFRRLFSDTDWKHATAEVALIVVGVTLALWADAWVENRRDAAREAARLTALDADTKETLAAVSSAHRDVAAAATSLRQILVLRPPYKPRMESSNLLRHGLLFGLALHPEMSVYDDLKNSGELALLKNSDLRQALSSMEAGLEQVRMMQSDLTTVQQLNVDSFMVDHMDLMSFYGNLTGLDQADGQITDFSFLADQKFRNRILLKLDLVTQLEMVLAETEARVLEVNNRIELELRE